MNDDNVVYRDKNGRFVPGVSGNPGGKSQEAAELEKALRAIADPEKLAAKLWELVEEGSLAAIRYVYDRLCGKPTETVVLPNPIAMPKVVGYYPAGTGHDERDTTQEAITG